MNIDKINLKDFCQHEDFSIDLSPGVNLLLGPVGSGKSTTLRALEFGLTGSMPVTRRLEENIRGLGDEKLASEAKVHIDFTGHDQPGSVERVIKADGGSKAYFNHLDIKVQSVSKVNQEMQDLLGLDTRTAGQLMFVRQGELHTLLSARDAERKTLLQKLFGVSFLSGLSDKLYEERERYASFKVPDETPDEIQEYIQSAQKDLQEAEKAAQSFRKLADPDIIKKHRQALHDHSMGVSASEELQQCKENEKQVYLQLEKTNKQLEDANSRQEDAQLALDSASDEAQGAQEVLARAEFVKSARTNHKKAKAGLEEREKQLKKHLDTKIEPVEDPTKTLQEVEPELKRQQDELQRCRDFLRAFKSTSHNHQCPTCGTEAVVDKDGNKVDLERLIQETKDRKETLEAETNETSALVKAIKQDWDEYQKKIEWFENRKMLLESQRDQAKDILDQLGDPPEEVDEQNAKEKLDALEQAKTICNQLNQMVNQLQQTVERKNQELLSIAGNIEKAQEKTKLKLDDETIKKTRQELEEMEKYNQQAAQKEGESEQIRKQVELLNRRLSKAVKAMEKIKGQTQYREVLDHARQLVHRDKLPALLTQPFVSSLNRMWNETLSMLAMTFTAELISSPGQDDDLSFVFYFPEGYAQSYQLSGGQRCAASLSLLIAVNRLLSRSNLLVLDEPTYGFSRAELELLPEVMRNLQTYAVSRGLQVIMVTHEQSLFSDFDNVVELDSIESQ